MSRRVWTNDEEAILRAEFEKGASDKEIGAILKRPAAGVVKRRGTLGLKREEFAPWLKDYYTTHERKEVLQKAKNRKRAHKQFTEAEISIIKDLVAQGLPLKRIAKKGARLLRRTVGGVYQFVLRNKRRFFSQIEVQPTKKAEKLIKVSEQKLTAFPLHETNINIKTAKQNAVYLLPLIEEMQKRGVSSVNLELN